MSSKISELMRPPTLPGPRGELVRAFIEAMRAHSTASVMMHTAISSKFGLSITDFKTLDILLRMGPLTAGELGEHTALATASVTGLIDRLERKGFVRRVRDDEDRRRIIVEPIDERFIEFEANFVAFKKAGDEHLAGYSDSELSIITAFLSRSADLVRDETAKLTGRKPRTPHAED